MPPLARLAGRNQYAPMGTQLSEISVHLRSYRAARLHRRLAQRTQLASPVPSAAAQGSPEGNARGDDRNDQNGHDDQLEQQRGADDQVAAADVRAWTARRSGDELTHRTIRRQRGRQRKWVVIRCARRRPTR